MNGFAIVVLCVLIACGYGIMHDQVTARLCIEYFTIGHPPLFSVPVDSPTLIGFAWGVIATWWVGLGLGIPLAAAARLGARPKRSARSLVLPLLTLAAIACLLAIAAGGIGYKLGVSNVVVLHEPLASDVEADKHPAFIANLFAHNMSYFVGTVGGIVLIAMTWRSRTTSSIGTF
jgi:hypothetical protein